MLNRKPGKVDIIITSRNQLSYLKMCIESIKRNTFYPHNIIVINSGTDGTAKWLNEIEQQDIIKINCGPDDLHFSAHNNMGIKILKRNS